MKVDVLVNLSSQKVRRDSNLMAIYITEYKKAFGITPNCAGCTFSKDFEKLRKYVLRWELPKQQKTQTNTNDMTTFKLKKKQGKILSYKKDGKTFRIYDTAMTDSFAVAYLTNGTEEQLKQRKELFSKLPDALVEVNEVEVVKEETKKNLILINEKEYSLEDALELLNKAELTTKTTSLKGVQKYINKLSKEDLEKLDQ